MYIPNQFREDRWPVLVEAMRDIRFASLVTAAGAEFHASHVPVLLRENEGMVTIAAHVARPNPHWRALSEPRPTVAIFQGPQADVSPSFYASKREHGKVVPTWNYVIVEARGTMETITDPEWLKVHLTDLTDASERDRDQPWAVSDAPGDFIQNLARAIVGVRMTVVSLEGSSGN